MPGQVIGSAGPTTSGRMDAYAPRLLDAGLKGMIGKGGRSASVIEAVVRNRAVYFAAVGGTAALLAKRIKKVEMVAYEDLGTEAIRKFWVENFPVIVVNDSEGRDLFSEGYKAYAKD
jgi:fumarate hydratase subunit beta